MKVSKTALLVIAGIVWMIAGFNVARLGIISYGEVSAKWYFYLLSVVTFLGFGAMFRALTHKNIRRINAYTERRPFWNFFNLKSYIIMAIMMGGGIGLRAAGVFPAPFVAVFYTGLGCALFLAGVLYFIYLARRRT